MAATAPDVASTLDSAFRLTRRRLVPFLLLIYILSFLDRANIGFAKQAFQASAGISDAAYALGAGLFFLTYALLEVPSNLVMHRVGARIWMARIMVTRGLVSAAVPWLCALAAAFVLPRLGRPGLRLAPGRALRPRLHHPDRRGPDLGAAARCARCGILGAPALIPSLHGRPGYEAAALRPNWSGRHGQEAVPDLSQSG